MVTKASAGIPMLCEAIPLQRDHGDMLKFLHENETDYLIITHKLKEWISPLWKTSGYASEETSRGIRLDRLATKI